MKNGIEIERRFLITRLSPAFPQNLRTAFIEQGYFETWDILRSFRVRITNKEAAEITLKHGKGLVRKEKHHPAIPLGLGRDLLRLSTHSFDKTRHFHEGWEIDFFHPPLRGIILSEFELSTPDEPCTLAPWIGEGIEVTEILTNLHLARMATVLRGTDTDALSLLLPRMGRSVRKVALIGGPGAGKSGVIETLRPEFGNMVQFVPEVATILIAQVGIPPGGNVYERRRFQLTVYSIQRMFEYTSSEVAVENKKNLLVVDRGLVDSAGYLPHGPADYRMLFGRSIEEDYEEYACVIFLELPPRDVYEAIRRNNPARKETYEEACEISGKLYRVWERHPNFVCMPSGGGWDEKIEGVRRVLHLLRHIAR